MNRVKTHCACGKPLRQDGLKHCVGCHDDKAPDEFYGRTGAKDGLQSRCKRCQIDANNERTKESRRLGRVREVHYDTTDSGKDGDSFDLDPVEVRSLLVDHDRCIVLQLIGDTEREISFEVFANGAPLPETLVLAQKAGFLVVQSGTPKAVRPRRRSELVSERKALLEIALTAIGGDPDSAADQLMALENRRIYE